MATTLDLNVTYNGKEPGSIGEAIINDVLNSPELTSLGYAVRTDVKTKEKMIFISMDEEVTRKRTGCVTPDLGGVHMREKYMEPTNLEISQHYCAEDFADTIAELARKVGADVNDLTGTEIETILTRLVAPIWRRDKLTIAEFGDTASANPFLSPLDGNWTQIFLGATGNTKDISKCVVTFKFAYQKNRTSISICDGLIVPAKKGWEYLWVSYKNVEDANKLTQQPDSAYVEQIYHEGNYADIGIG